MGDMAAIEFHAAMPRRRQRAIPRRLVNLEAWRATRHQKCAVALAPGLYRRDRQYNEHIGERSVGHPGFFAEDAVAIGVFLRSRAQQLWMRTDARFGDRDRRNVRQPAFALLQCAEAIQEEAGHDLAACIALSQEAGALDNLGFLACNRG